ncbi:MAG: protein phosphatase 2C domain-containing protein [Firmicutes bacterium]|nr:protein phosphatase 2C domain-containing protein [[Eubacterium] siraeum]MCM1487066.1 protein phosphatase 2C domain-containing protein [Bacillota bacterium]
MRIITDNSIGGLGGFFAPPEETAAKTEPVTAEEVGATAEETTVTEAQPAAAEETAAAQPIVTTEEITAAKTTEDGGLAGLEEILGGADGEETAYTAQPPDAPKSDVQMPMPLLIGLIAAICVLAAVIILLVTKLKKSKKGGANQPQPAAYPINTAAAPNTAAAGAVPAPSPTVAAADSVNTAAGQNTAPSQTAKASDSANVPSGQNVKSDVGNTVEIKKKAENMNNPAELPITVTLGDGHSKPKFSYEIGNVHNQGRREEQQDSFCISDVSNKSDLENKGLMAVVADGMGGLESGASVSQLVSNIFLSRYRSSAVPDCKSFLYEAVMESEQEVKKYIETNRVDGGSTLVAVMIKDGMLSYISVGDSFIFLIRKGKLIKLNVEHTYGNLLRERAARGEIDPEEAEINPKRASLTSYIGIDNLRLIDKNDTPIPIMDGDILFLCSDGVYNALGDNALLEVMTGGEFSEAAERVEQTVLMQNIATQDNFTAVMIKITGGK